MRSSAKTAINAVYATKRWPLVSIGIIEVRGMLDFRSRIVLPGGDGDWANLWYGDSVWASIRH